MSSLPMLQPVSWEQLPATLANSLPEAERQIYQVIWDCALACTLVAPILQHTRTVFQHEQLRLAIAGIEPSPNKVGYWRFRQDYPYYAFPAQITPPPSQAIQVLATHIVPVGAPTLGSLLLAIQELEIGSALSVTDSLESLLTATDSPLLILRGNERKQPMTVGVTALGGERLAEWEALDLTGVAAKTSTVIAAIAEGQLSYQDGLIAITSDTSLSYSAAHYIDAQCAKWKGLSRNEGLAALAVANNKPVHHEGLPKWLDPEVNLSAEHPLRAVKRDMESALAIEKPNWRAITAEQRAQARLDWLIARQGEYLDCLPVMTGEEGRFSAVRYWLTGVKG